MAEYLTPGKARASRRSKFRGKSGSLVVAFVLLFSPLAVQAKAENDVGFQPVTPTVDQARANILIARQLQFTHFRDLSINNSLSSDVFNAYLKYLDNQRVYLTQQDQVGS